MTTELTYLFPTGGNADDIVRKSVRAYMAFQGVNVEALAPRAEMSVATLYRKLAGKGSAQAFRAGEVASLAHALGVEVANLYGGLNGPGGPSGGPGSPVRPGAGFGSTARNTLNDLRALAAVA